MMQLLNWWFNMFPLQLALFGGVGASNADYESLATAKLMEMNGHSADKIWKETGWGRNPNGDWRYEIDDSQMKYKDENGKTLGEVLDHPKLFEAYPDIQNIPVQIDTPGMFDDGRPTGEYHAPTSQIKARGLSFDLPPLLNHEIQHDIQQREGGPNYLQGQYNWTQDQYDQLMGRKPSDPPTLQQLWEKYKRLPLEQESIESANRINMNEQQRKDKPPSWIK